MNRQQRWQAWLVALGLLATDFVTKRLVLGAAETLRFERVELLGTWVRLAYVRNPGSAMGLFPVGRWVLVAVSIVAAIFLVHLLLTTASEHRLRRIAMGAILGGALGNLVDRLFYGGNVVDFIDIGIGTHRFYTFNVADMGVTIGGVLLFLAILGEEIRDRRRPRPAPGPEVAEDARHE